MTLFLSVSTRRSSWVAMTIIFPSLLSFKRSLMISSAFLGSRFPVGSSAMIISGLCMSALAIAVRWSSHHESDSMNLSFLVRSHTSASTSGTLLWIIWLSYPETSIANATFSFTVFLGRSLKSWNITPIFLLKERRSLQDRVYISLLCSSSICPSFGERAQIILLMKLVFPLQELPMRNTNSHDCIVVCTCFRMVRSP